MEPFHHFGFMLVSENSRCVQPSLNIFANKNSRGVSRPEHVLCGAVFAAGGIDECGRCDTVLGFWFFKRLNAEAVEEGDVNAVHIRILDENAGDVVVLACVCQ